MDICVDAFAESNFARLDKGQRNVDYGTPEIRRLASRLELDSYFDKMNAAWK